MERNRNESFSVSIIVYSAERCHRRTYQLNDIDIDYRDVSDLASVKEKGEKQAWKKLRVIDWMKFLCF